MTQTRTPSSPTIHAKNIDNTSVERKKLLVTTTSSPTVVTKPVENVHFALTSTEPTNGHAVSFKT